MGPGVLVDRPVIGVVTGGPGSDVMILKFQLRLAGEGREIGSNAMRQIDYP